MFDLDNISVMIIDEISTIQAYILDYINVCLQEAKQNFNAPFGGIALVMIGAFDQLPSFVGSPIPEVVMRMLQEISPAEIVSSTFTKKILTMMSPQSAGGEWEIF